MQAKAAHLRSEVRRLTEIAAATAAKRDPLPGASLAGPKESGRERGADRRPATTTGVNVVRTKRQGCGLSMFCAS